MTRRPSASVPRILALLEGRWRCSVEFRREVWTECLIRSEDDCYVGVGTDDPSALASALTRMFPSRVAWSLLEEALAHAPEPEGGRAGTSSQNETSGAAPAPPAAPPSSKASTSVKRSSGSPTVIRRRAEPGPTPEASPAPEDAEDPPEPLASAPGTSRTFSARREIVVQTAVTRSAPSTSSASPSSPYASASPAPRSAALLMETPESSEQAYADVVSLEQHAMALMPELALMAPRLLRLHLMGWAARARSYEEQHPGDQRLTQAVTDLFSKLGRTSKQLWPGNVRALSAEAIPAECLGDLDTRATPQSWREIADLSAQTIENLHARPGVDEYGWTDGERLHPPPADPAKLLGECVAFCRALQQRPLPDRLPPELAEELQRTARRLRWLRGSTPDEREWGLAMGTLRQLSQKQQPVARLIKELLDPGFCPTEPWAKLLGHDPDKKRRQKLRREILQSIPGVGASEAEVLAWLVRAIEAELTNPELARNLGPHRELVLSWDAAELADQDRRVRSRITKLQRILKGELPMGGAGEEEPEEESPESVSEVAAPTRAREFDLAEAFTKGKHALFVSNRDDPELKAQLEKTFQLEITWCVAEPRRIQAVAQAIRSKAYDFVLSATGFQSHKVDRALAEAAQQSGVRFFRVDRGRPLACARAIVRDLGLATRAA